jgi:hypothetical protein
MFPLRSLRKVPCPIFPDAPKANVSAHNVHITCKRLGVFLLCPPLNMRRPHPQKRDEAKRDIICHRPGPKDLGRIDR